MPKIVDNVLTFDPNTLGGFNIELQSCSGDSIEGSNGAYAHMSYVFFAIYVSDNLVAPTGDCLIAGANSSVVGADCSTVDSTTTIKWKLASGFLFRAGETTADCPSGLYGYVVSNSTGLPDGVTAPITLACSSDATQTVFPFTVLIQRDRKRMEYQRGAFM
ncbi:hypothetical protein M422DRAFT_50094 [Sphaerobolus stellatus SS14]|uniref:Uncharacterized protein n=1 Tax=Sphaerobolus stellatus (strain SS14) TaxID=990650 RepID=A0A0C9U5A4_SPHS4|nr:hypothetical protein M422DRAFT_50094 [Sphaerobolus stellatus SS14]